MNDPQTDGLLRQLRSRDPREAWARFLEIYSPLLLDVVRLFEREEDAAADCYVFICERLCRDNFRKLTRFRPDGPARFSTWLCAVTRNLCLDWHRREVGRARVFESVGRLPALEQEIFRSVFVEILPVEEAFLQLRPRFPGLTVGQLNEGVGRVQQALTARQRWLLAARRNRGLAAVTSSSGPEDADLATVPSDQPNPETWAGLREEHDALVRAMSGLSARERLLVRLRFGRGLTLDEIARLLQLDSPQAADRRIREAVEKLRKEMVERGRKSAGPVRVIQQAGKEQP